jgi:hypothetical protein
MTHSRYALTIDDNSASKPSMHRFDVRRLIFGIPEISSKIRIPVEFEIPLANSNTGSASTSSVRNSCCELFSF